MSQAPTPGSSPTPDQRNRPLVALVCPAPFDPLWMPTIRDFAEAIAYTKMPRRLAVLDTPGLNELARAIDPEAAIYTPMNPSPWQVTQRAVDLLDDVAQSGAGAGVVVFVGAPCLSEITRQSEVRRCFGRNPHDPWGIACAATQMRQPDEERLPLFVVPLPQWRGVALPHWWRGGWTHGAARGAWGRAWRFVAEPDPAPVEVTVQAGLWSPADDQRLVKRPDRTLASDDPRHR